VLVLLLAILGYIITMYYFCGVLWYYVGFLALIILGFAVPTFVLRKTHKLHVHHYTVGMVIIAMLGYQSIPAAIFHGLANGMMIEGGSRWGYDPIWY
jgi:hypothetical protein